MEHIEFRAKYESIPNVVLVSRAVSQLVTSSDTGAESHHLATPSSGLTKNMITNASFRTKKLEMDIPRKESDEDADREFAEKMGIIPEDVEAEVERMSKMNLKDADNVDGGENEKVKISEKLKAKMENVRDNVKENVRNQIRKKDKDKDKEKDKERGISESSADKDEIPVVKGLLTH